MPRLHNRAALIVASTVALVAADARAQTATLLDGFGGPADFGTEAVPRGDDGSSPEIVLGANFPSGVTVNGQNFTSVFVNINGNLSFGTPLMAYTPMAFPGAAVPMIAPWWADVDTRADDAGAENDGVYWHVETGRLVATWFDVGYFNQHRDLRDSFQIVMTDASAAGAPGDVDLEFRYNRCEWTTGDLSGGDGGLGGTIAGAGYDFTSVKGGSGTAYSVLPGSGTPLVQGLCTGSNVGMPGVWQLHVRAGAVAFCGNGVVDPGEECDPAALPPVPCTPDCHLCSDPTCGGGDGGPLPDVLFPDVLFPDAPFFPDVPVLDVPLPDVQFPDVVFFPDVPLPDVAPPTDASAIDAGMDAVVADSGLDARGTDASASSVQRYAGGGLINCAVSAPAAGRGGGTGLLCMAVGWVLVRRRRRAA